MELTNVGNKDIEKFDLGMNIKPGNTIIGVQAKGDDRYHTTTYSPEVSIAEPASEIDFVLQPFNRKNKYSITLVINAAERNLAEQIELSKSLPVTFIDTDTRSNPEMISAANTTAFAAWLVWVLGKEFLKDFGFFVDVLSSVVMLAGFAMLTYFFYRLRYFK